MTEQQFRNKVKKLQVELNKLIDNRVDKILESGAIDLNDWSNNFALPNIFIHAIANEITRKFKITEKYLGVSENIKDAFVSSSKPMKLWQHAEAWQREHGREMPKDQNSPQWIKMYEQWLRWAFEDFSKPLQPGDEYEQD